MPYGKRSSRQRPHDAASSSRVPSVEREQPGPCRPLRPEREDGAQMAQAFLSNAVEVFPYKIHTVLTDNGMAFADLPKNRDGPSRRFLEPHIFDRVCMKNGI